MRSIFATALLIASVALAAPQDSKTKPDFGGTWRCIDAPKHSVLTDSTLVIVQNDPQIKMSRKLRAEGDAIDLVFYSDGRGDTNSGILRIKRDDTYKPSPLSVTNWDGRKLLTKYSIMSEYREPSGAMRFGTISTTDAWELSKDGNKLMQTRTVRISTINGAREVLPAQGFLSESKYVYAREP